MTDRSTSPAAQRVAWELLLLPAAAQLALHLFTNGRFGMFRDEYYYLACASRPAWGYVDQPALSIWLLGLWRALFGDSVESIRVLPALCGAGLIVLTGMTAAELGGRRWAQLFAAVAAGIGLAGLVVFGFYSMNCYDFLVWLGAYFFVARIARTGDGRWWYWLGAVLAAGFLNKIGIVVFGMALAPALLATKHRRFFADRRLYFAGAVAALGALPYVLWNRVNGWPTLAFIASAKSGKIVHFSPLDFLKECALEAHPATLAIWAGGLLWLLFARTARPWRLVGILFVATFVILVAQSSKPYYFAASFPVMMAAGGAAWERWTAGRRLRWARWALLAVLLAGGALTAPMGVPLLDPDRTVAYGRRLGITPAPQEIGHTSALPQYFSDRFGWENLARVVSEVYAGLPPRERDRCMVFGRNYGHAGSLEYWARKYDLPPVCCPHNNYWLWGPPPGVRDVVIVLHGDRDDLEHRFEEVVEAAVAESPFALDTPITIWLCRRPRIPLRELWTEFRNFG